MKRRFPNASTKAYGGALFFAVLVGFSFLGIKACVPFANTLQVLVHRYNFAFLALVVLWLCGATIKFKGKPKRDLIIMAACYLGFMVLQVVGLYFATSIEGAIFFAIIPIVVRIFAAIFLKESATLLQNLSMCLTVAALLAMIVFNSREVSFDPVGTVILLLSSCAMAVSNVYMRHVRQQYRPMEISAAIILSGFILFNLAFLVYGIGAGTLHSYVAPLQHGEFLFAGAYLGVGCILLSTQLMSYCLSKMEAVKAAVFGNVSTAISILAGAWILGESLRVYHVVCTGLIVAGVVGLSLLGRKDPGELHAAVEDEKENEETECET